MNSQPYKILLVEPEPSMMEILVASLVRRFDAHITCVADAESCLDIDVADPHDLIIAELAPDVIDGLGLAARIMTLGAKPIILLGDEISGDEAIEAMRLGVRDLFRKPFPVEQLLDAAQRLIRHRDARLPRQSTHG